MSPTNGFGEHHRYINALNLGAILHVAILGNCVGDHDRFKTRVVDAGNCRAAEDSVRENRVDFGGARFEQLFSRMASCPARVGHIVNKNRDSVFDVTDEHH